MLIHAEVKQSEHPRIVFESERDHRKLLNAVLGTRNSWKEFVDPSDPANLDMSVAWVSTPFPLVQSPVVLALVRRQGGSDCSYQPALFAEVSGRVTAIAPSLPDFYTRGGIYLSGGRGGRPLTLQVLSERYDWSHDVHYQGPSRMAVYTYTYDALPKRFRLSSMRVVRTDQLRMPGEDLMKAFGRFPQC